MNYIRALFVWLYNNCSFWWVFYPCLVLAFVGGLFLVAITDDMKERDRKEEILSDSRFEVMENFSTVIPRNGYNKEIHVMVLKDNKANNCYLYMWAGASREGHALTLIPCEPEEVNFSSTQLEIEGVL